MTGVITVLAYEDGVGALESIEADPKPILGGLDPYSSLKALLLFHSFWEFGGRLCYLHQGN